MKKQIIILLILIILNFASYLYAKRNRGIESVMPSSYSCFIMEDVKTSIIMKHIDIDENYAIDKEYYYIITNNNSTFDARTKHNYLFENLKYSRYKKTNSKKALNLSIGKYVSNQTGYRCMISSYRKN